MKEQLTNIVFHFDAESHQNGLNTLQSIINMNNQNFELTMLTNDEKKAATLTANLIPETIHISYSDYDKTRPAASLNSAFRQGQAPYILYIFNESAAITLKQSALDLYHLAAGRAADFSYIYADYELQEQNDSKEIHLLKHHIGRVRDNQDYGFVYFINRQKFENSAGLDENVKYNALYDLRLRLSTQAEPLHIANRYAGSLYTVKASGKSHNVFDYLLASKESQLEAEELLSAHLKRIGAYLESGAHYSNRPNVAGEATLEASVIIPVNNRPEFIGSAIESVQAQTVQSVEAIIVVNGGQDDPTIPEVKRYLPGGDKYSADKPAVQLVVVDINNLGLCLNMGAQVSNSIYYVQLDSDDQLKDDAVEKILKVYSNDPKIGMVIGSYEVWEQKDTGELVRMEDIPVVTHDEWTEENGRNNLLRINGAGAPRSIPIQLIRDIGFSVNEEPFARNYGEDYNMVMMISEKHRIGRVWDAIYKVIRHSGGTDHNIDQHTIDRNDEAKDFMRLEAIQRRIELNK